ncbi:MAG: single-stranded DNA-binding protein [Pyrobaculum sp.]
MALYNKVIMIAKVVKPPEHRVSASGNSILRIRVASRNPVHKSPHLFIDVYAFGKLADGLVNKVERGNVIIVEGSLAYREWGDATGKKRSYYEVWAESIKFLDSLNSQEKLVVEDLIGGFENSEVFDDDDLPPF